MKITNEILREYKNRLINKNFSKGVITMKILAIGGGENGRPGKSYEIKQFDEEIVKMPGKVNPNFLFISFTQSSYESAENYYNIIKR